MCDKLSDEYAHNHTLRRARKEITSECRLKKKYPLHPIYFTIIRIYIRRKQKSNKNTVVLVMLELASLELCQPHDTHGPSISAIGISFLNFQV